MSKTILMATVAFGLMAAALVPMGSQPKVASHEHSARVVAESELRGNAFAESEFRHNDFAESELRRNDFASNEYNAEAAA